MLDIRRLSSEEWKLLRDVRLSALRESPRFFLADHDEQSNYADQYWRDEFIRGDWHIGVKDGDVVSLIGVIRDDINWPGECFLEYIWVAPDSRRSKFATRMVTIVLDLLKAEGMRAANLWVMDGNEPAVHFYTRLGFRTTSEVNPIKVRPGRTEERFRKDF
jgi:ribosomal protein S18 acetylase RimI-like enzyme